MEITDSTNLAQAYAFMPIAWSSGATLGLVLSCNPLQSGSFAIRSPYVGGSLSNPAKRFPDVFGHWEFFKIHPYFLACAAPATFSALAWLVTLLFLKEVSVLYNRFRQLKVATRLSLTVSRSVN